MLLIGIDEAGYGPTIGPLCHGYCALRTPAFDGRAPDLYALLHPAVMRHPARTGSLTIDDSKKVYSTARGLGLLHRGVSTFLECVEGSAPEQLRAPIQHAGELFQRLLPASDRARLDAEPWGEKGTFIFSSQAPQNAQRAGTEKKYVPFSFSLREALQKARVSVLTVGARSLCAKDYNAALRIRGNKAEVSWQVIAAQCAALLAMAGPHEDVHLVIDRQGGRKFYAARLAELFSGALPWVEQETPRESRYRIASGGRTVRVSFIVEADGQDLPVALSSMAAKLARELAMQRLNAFFRRHAPDLKPTAGYAADARRFLRQTASLRERLGIPDDQLIRVK